MTIYFAPNSFDCPPDVRIPVIDSGSLVKKLADAEQAEAAVIVLLTKEEIHFVASHFRTLGLLEAEILMNIADVEYPSEWLLAAQLMGRADALSVFDSDRGERADQQREVQSITRKLDDLEASEREAKRLEGEQDSFLLGKKLLDKEKRKETFDAPGTDQWE